MSVSYHDYYKNGYIEWKQFLSQAAPEESCCRLQGDSQCRSVIDKRNHHWMWCLPLFIEP
jgi:hypothetical protein